MAKQAATSHSNDARHVTVLGQGRGYFEGKGHYRMLYDFLDKHLKQDRIWHRIVLLISEWRMSSSC